MRNRGPEWFKQLIAAFGGTLCLPDWVVFHIDSIRPGDRMSQSPTYSTHLGIAISTPRETNLLTPRFLPRGSNPRFRQTLPEPEKILPVT